MRKLFSLACVIPALLAGQSLKDFEKKVTEFTLANGMHFILAERHEAPIVSFHTYANVGSVDDPSGSTGLAHMFEHMAFKGTPTIGTKNQAVHVMTAKGNSHSISIVKCHLLVGFSVSVGVRQLPQFWDTGVINFIANRQDASACSIFNRVESIGKNRGLIGVTVTVLIFFPTSSRASTVRMTSNSGNSAIDVLQDCERGR